MLGHPHERADDGLGIEESVGGRGLDCGDPDVRRDADDADPVLCGRDGAGRAWPPPSSSPSSSLVANAAVAAAPCTELSADSMSAANDGFAEVTTATPILS